MTIRPPRARLWLALAVAVLLTATALLAYRPALTGQFLWDDDTLVTESTLVKASDGLYRMWFTTEPLDYWPLTNTSFWLEWRLWGMNPAGYHLTNLLLHIASGLLLWRILLRLSIPGALLAAFLFVLHPVNVESVAWIAQRKNTLSMVFFLLSILWYLRVDGTTETAPQPSVVAAPRGKKRNASPVAAREPSIRHWYWLSLLAFVLSMLSKGSVAILPGLLLLIAWWRRDTITRLDVRRTLPFFVIAAGLTALNIWFQAHLMTGAIRDVTLLQRLLGAGAIVWFYLSKALLPIRLMFVYPQWDVRPDDVRWWLPAIAAVAVTTLLIWRRRQPAVRAMLFAWCAFCLALLPVMGLTDVYYMRYSLVADHYQYIAIIAVVAGIAAVVAALATRLAAAASSSSFGSRPVSAVALSVAVLTAPAIVTHRQATQYVDAETLYRATLAQNPSAWLIHNLLGVVMVGRSLPEAVQHFNAAVRLNPQLFEAQNNLCLATQQSGKPVDVVEACSAAIRLNPNLARAHNGLGAALAALARPAEARTEFETALRLQPDYPDAHNNLANVLLASGHEAEAVDHYRRSLAATPSAITRQNLGFALDRLGRHEEAIEQYREALRVDPALSEARTRLDVLLRGAGPADAVEHYRDLLKSHPGRIATHASLGDALLEAARPAEAIEEYKIALKALPDDPAVHFGLASALQEAGQSTEAEAHFLDAIRLKPGYAEAFRHLGDLLQSQGRLPEAVSRYTESLTHDSKSAEAHNNLGVALVRLGRTSEGLEHFKTAVALDPNYVDARNNLNRTVKGR